MIQGNSNMESIFEDCCQDMLFILYYWLAERELGNWHGFLSPHYNILDSIFSTSSFFLANW